MSRRKRTYGRVRTRISEVEAFNVMASERGVGYRDLKRRRSLRCRKRELRRKRRFFYLDFVTLTARFAAAVGRDVEANHKDNRIMEVGRQNIRGIRVNNVFPRARGAVSEVPDPLRVLSGGRTLKTAHIDYTQILRGIGIALLKFEIRRCCR